MRGMWWHTAWISCHLHVTCEWREGLTQVEASLWVIVTDTPWQSSSFPVTFVSPALPPISYLSDLSYSSQVPCQRTLGCRHPNPSSIISDFALWSLGEGKRESGFQHLTHLSPISHWIWWGNPSVSLQDRRSRKINILLLNEPSASLKHLRTNQTQVKPTFLSILFSI